MCINISLQVQLFLCISSSKRSWSGSSMILQLNFHHDYFQEMKLSRMRVHSQQLEFIASYLCYLGRLPDKPYMRQGGARTSTPGTSQHFITLDHLWLPCISTANERMAVAAGGRKLYENTSSKLLPSYLWLLPLIIIKEKWWHLDIYHMHLFFACYLYVQLKHGHHTENFSNTN